MSQRAIRIALTIAAVVIATAVSILAVGQFGTGLDPVTGINQAGANLFALILAIALVIGFVVYAAVEYLQTGSFASISAQFDTRTIVLMPVAIALNVVLGQAVAAVLKVPIYLDSIGTILVGALAGPIAGAVTGFLANILWTYVLPPPFHSDIAAAFAIVAAIIGLLAGIFGRAGWVRPRPGRSTAQLALGGSVAVGLIILLAFLAYVGYLATLGDLGPRPGVEPTLFLVVAILVIALVAITVVGLIALLFVRRDLAAAYVVVAGVITGIVAALISAPISANVFGGVTGSGTDFLVAAFRQAGADVQASALGQGLISDPIDKVTTFFVVYLVLNAMGRRTKARFPQGERLIERGPDRAAEGARA